MRHLNSGRSLSRTASHRKAMLSNMARSLIKYEIIETTDGKAKELRRVTDRLITLGKRGTLHARRQAIALLNDRDLVGKLFEDRSEEHTSELQSRPHLVCRLLLEKKKIKRAVQQ